MPKSSTRNPCGVWSKDSSRRIRGRAWKIFTQRYCEPYKANTAYRQPKQKDDGHVEVINPTRNSFLDFLLQTFSPSSIQGVISQLRPPDEPNNQKQPQTPRPTRSTPLVAKRQQVPRSRCESLQLFVAFLLITLIVLNVILFLKLWTLEGKRGSGEDQFPDFSKLR